MKVLTPLVSAGVLRSLKGPNGGFRLARAASQITLLEVWRRWTAPSALRRPGWRGCGTASTPAWRGSASASRRRCAAGLGRSASRTSPARPGPPAARGPSSRPRDGPVGAVAGSKGVARSESNEGLAAAGPDRLAGAGPDGAGGVFPYSARRGPREGRPRRAVVVLLDRLQPAVQPNRQGRSRAVDRATLCRLARRPQRPANA
jgi:hypothetical protein